MNLMEMENCSMEIARVMQREPLLMEQFYRVKRKLISIYMNSLQLIGIGGNRKITNWTEKEKCIDCQNHLNCQEMKKKQVVIISFTMEI